jgi:hypothetical protein
LEIRLDQKNQRPPPKPKSIEIQIDYFDSQIPDYEEAFSDHDAFPDYSLGLEDIKVDRERIFKFGGFIPPLKASSYR